MINKTTQITTFFALFYKQMVIFKSDYHRMVINCFVWSSCLLFSFCYFMPLMGTAKNFGFFMFPAMVASWGLFGIIANSTALISDITGEKTIEYELTLPINQWMVFAKIALSNMYRSFLVSLTLIPFGIMLLYLFCAQFFININPIKTVVLLLLANCFYGFASIFAASFMYRVSDVRNVWMRFIFPLWWIGGFTFNVNTALKASPAFGFIMKCNPIVYINEGMRAAMLGQTGYISFAKCCLVLLVSTAIVGFIGIKRFLKRLDCL